MVGRNLFSELPAGGCKSDSTVLEDAALISRGPMLSLPGPVLANELPEAAAQESRISSAQVHFMELFGSDKVWLSQEAP